MDKRQLYSHIVFGESHERSLVPSLFYDIPLNPLPSKINQVRIDNEFYPHDQQPDDLDYVFRGEFDGARMPTLEQVRERKFKDVREPGIRVQPTEDYHDRHLRRIAKGRELRAFDGNGYYFLKPDTE